MTVEIKLMENASNASDCDPVACVFDAFYNACDVASSDASNRDPTSTT